MFIDFQVANFRSFRDLTTLSMRAFPKRANDKGADEDHVYQIGGQRMLKSKAIFGANASGKSNLIKALSTFVTTVSKSVEREGLPKLVWEDSFGLAADWNKQAIFFQVNILIDNVVYRYGFQIFMGLISYEWLFSRKDSEANEVELFMRSTEKGVKVGSAFKGAKTFAKQATNSKHEIFRSDSLFLTGAALSGVKTASLLRDEIRRIMIVDGIDDSNIVQVSMDILEKGNEIQKTFIKSFMRASDTGVEDLELAELPDNRVPKDLHPNGKVRSLHSKHSRYDDDGNAIDYVTVPFQDWESEGTGKLFGLSAPIMVSLRTGRTLVIDEFDARLHPNITLKIVETFHNEKTNPNHAQLIFVTHDASLLQRAELRRDQISIIDKDKYGVSQLTTLAEYRGVRKDASYEKEYLRGAYHGVGKLGLLDRVIADFLTAEESNNDISAAQ